MTFWPLTSMAWSEEMCKCRRVNGLESTLCGYVSWLFRERGWFDCCCQRGCGCMLPFIKKGGKVLKELKNVKGAGRCFAKS